MARFAEQTTVPVDRSIGELRSLVSRHGADGFGYMEQAGESLVQFACSGWVVRFRIELPEAEEFERTPTGRRRSKPKVIAEAREQASRRLWRALVLVIKAKFEAVESGISTFEDEFLAHIILPNSQTVGSVLRPQLDRVRTGDLTQISVIKQIQSPIAEHIKR